LTEANFILFRGELVRSNYKISDHHLCLY